MDHKRRCPFCNAEVDDDARFCPNCGEELLGGCHVTAAGESSSSSYTTKNKTTSSPDSGAEKISSNAKAALVLGIVSLVVPFARLVTSILAIVFGAKTKDKEPYGKAGFILGIIGLCFFCAFDIYKAIHWGMTDTF